MGSASGGMNMGRDRAHGNTNYTYLGQDSQTNPLQDYGSLLAQLLGQNQAQTNSLYGGNGYGGSYGKAPAYGSQMRSGGYGGGGGQQQGSGAYAPDGSYASNGPDGGGGVNDGSADPAGVSGVNGNYQYDTADAYYPRNPSWMNDGDNARPSSVRPQGSNLDPWNSSLGDSQGAPTGGLVGALQEWASGSRTPYEQQIGQGYLDQYNNPNDPYVAAQMQNMYENPSGALDNQAADSFGFLASGDTTGLEGETRGGYAGQAFGGPSGNENESRQAILDFIKGGGGASGTGFGLGGGGGSLSGSSSPVGLGSGYTGALSAYQQMVGGNGYSDAEKAAITNEGMGAARAGLDSAQAEMARKGELTGNRAGMYGAMAQMAANRSNTLGSQARQNTIGFANEAERRKEAGAGGLGNLAGIEGSLANAQLSANTSMNSANLANQAANRGMNLSAIQGLGNWDQNQRQNQQFGLTGMQQGDLARRQSMMGGATGLAGMGDAQYGRKAGALGALGQYGQQGRTNQMNALQGANAYANQGRANQQFGVQGLSGLYNTQNANQQAMLDKIFALFSTPDSKHYDNTDTSGSGGVSI